MRLVVVKNAPWRIFNAALTHFQPRLGAFPAATGRNPGTGIAQLQS